MGVATMSPFDPRYELFRLVVLMRDRQKSHRKDDPPFLRELVRRAEAEVDRFIDELLRPELPELPELLALDAPAVPLVPWPPELPEVPKGGFQ